MSIKIIGAGFGRTGTKSLQMALEQLGFGPCYHGTEVFAHPESVPTWNDALDGKSIDWARFLQGYAAIVDWPGCALYRTIMSAFPEAKVILTVRDPELWYQSAYQTIYQTSSAISPARGSHVSDRGDLHGLFERVIWQQTFGGRFADRPYALAIFQQHLAAVQDEVPAERLLVYDVQAGWEPLCRFLDCPLPMGQPFPHANETAAFLQMIREDRQRLVKHQHDSR